MTRVRCSQHTCVYWEGGYCGSSEIELDPEQLSCLTMDELDEHRMTHDVADWGEDLSKLEDEEDERDDEEKFRTRY